MLRSEPGEDVTPDDFVILGDPAPDEPRILYAMNLVGNIHSATSLINSVYPELIDYLLQVHYVYGVDNTICLFRAPASVIEKLKSSRR